MEQEKKIYLFANWKMYLDAKESSALARQLVAERQMLNDASIVMAVFPTALAMPNVLEITNGSALGVGAQNTHWVERGGYTGEISAAMFKAAGCQYVLIGHSERRHLFHETNHEVREKMEAALNVGLIPVLCVGETLQERQEKQTEEVVEAQLRAAFTELAWPKGKELIIAYEPVWSVNTGEACFPVEAERMGEFVIQCARGLLGEGCLIKILYGGSVRPDNVASYVKLPSLSGVLVGAASAQKESWLSILKSAHS